MWTKSIEWLNKCHHRILIIWQWYTRRGCSLGKMFCKQLSENFPGRPHKAKKHFDLNWGPKKYFLLRMCTIYHESYVLTCTLVYEPPFAQKWNWIPIYSSYVSSSVFRTCQCWWCWSNVIVTKLSSSHYTRSPLSVITSFAWASIM